MKTSKHDSIPAPLTLWRISIYENLDGIGAFRAGGRWNTRGHYAVYLAESPAGGMLEVLAHLALDEVPMPQSFRLLRIEIPSGISLAHLHPGSGTSWQDNLAITQTIGDDWLVSGKTALARIPSALMPYTWNYLLNPQHQDAAKIRIVEASDHLYDPRLLRTRM